MLEANRVGTLSVEGVIEFLVFYRFLGVGKHHTVISQWMCKNGVKWINKKDGRIITGIQ